jgi:hypothetical protein
MKWKIWYNDGTIVSGESIQDWIDSPSTGILGIYEFVDWSNGLKLSNIHCYGDWYWMNLDGSIGQSESFDTNGMFIPSNNPIDSILKQGGMTGNTEMLSIYSLILEETKNGN